MTGSAALVALIAVTGIALTTMATDDTSETSEDTPCLRNFWGKDLTEEEKVEMKAQFAEKKAIFAEKHETVKVALEANNYDAWVEAVGEDCPMLEKINQDNFPRLVEADGYMEQARGIFEELGIEGSKFGKGGMRGMHGFKGFKGINSIDN